ncbi:PREDICTED: BMP and activin membrane-bound inhibitor homolog [Acromyrmex echinatior]|uniref:BMP and activin membrane-bound inhibitor homolog n=1 Tax=Acromyrmex echinatior TaxID=103372 RepID=UPI000580C794|nr:PREDICTED: BMP and activin membrane-bound inhibitor homolog [Acromyrmex echinatior]
MMIAFGMLPRDVLTIAMMTTGLVVAVTSGAPTNSDAEDYEMFADKDAQSTDKGSSNAGEVRCYCNQPECVPQGYMCRGRSCFTKLPSYVNASLSRAEHTAHSGCLDENLINRQCPAGFLCCDQDLCNHVDSPAMRNRLNKTLRVLIDAQRPYLAPLHPNNRGNQVIDGWFPTATIIVAICGFIVLLMIASLAVRWLQPVPAQNANKFVPHRTSNNGPPLLGPPKVPLV